MNISIVRTESEFALLKDEWTTLHLDNCKSPFLSWDWMYLWWKFYSRRLNSVRELSIVTSRDDTGRLQSVWPFYIDIESTSIGKVKVLKFIGTTFESSDYLDIIVSKEIQKKDFKTIIKSAEFSRIIKSIDKIILKNILTDSFIFKHKSLFNFIKWQRFSTVCPYLTLPQDREELLGSLSKNMRSSLRRTYNKLSKDPDTALRIVMDKNQIDCAVENLFKLHGERFNEKETETNFVFSERGPFHKEIAKTFLDKKWLRFYEVLFKNEVIGSLYCFHFNDKLMYFQAGYNPDYSQFALGNQLILHAISDAINLNCKEFDFMRGDEAYKYKWTSTQRSLYTIEFGCSAKGKIELTKNTISKNVKKGLKKVLFIG